MVSGNNATVCRCRPVAVDEPKALAITFEDVAHFVKLGVVGGVPIVLPRLRDENEGAELSVGVIYMRTLRQELTMQSRWDW